MQDLLHQHMRTLDISRFGLEHMVHSYPAYTPNNPDSMASVLGSGDGLFGGCDSVMSNTRFVFDDICLGSKPYRQSMARISAQKSQQDKGTVAARAPDSCAPSTVNWNTFEADTEVLGKSATRAPPAGAMGEEHEAVLIKFRNAEAMIGILQDQMLQPAALMAIQQADGPSQQSIQRRTMTGQAFEYSGMLQSRSVDVTKQLRAEVDGGFEAGFETGFEAGFEARFEARFRAGFMAGFGAGRMSCQAGDRLLPYLTEDVKLPTLGSYEIEALPIQSMLPTSMKRQPRPSQAHGWTAVSTQVPYQPVLSLKNTSPERGETSSFIDGSSIPTNHTPASPNWGRQPSGFPSQSPHGPLSRW